MDKVYLAHIGLSLARVFAEQNNIPQPTMNIILDKDDPECRKIKAVGTCGYYRRGKVTVAVPLCASNNPMYSWPGFISDRTPYGVIQHELGHHVDEVKSGVDIYRTLPGAFFSDSIRNISGEPPITSYSPNNSEWFAEIFRLFVTNPDLLKQIRPRAYGALIANGLNPVVNVAAEDVMLKWQAPPRVFERMTKWINKGK
jgi:hypothetical protein